MDELIKEFREKTEQIKAGLVLSEAEKKQYIRTCNFLRRYGNIPYDYLMREAMDFSNKYLKEINLKINIAKKFYNEIKNDMSEIVFNVNVNPENFTYEKVCNILNVKYEVIKFYKKFDKKNSPLIKKCI